MSKKTHLKKKKKNPLLLGLSALLRASSSYGPFLFVSALNSALYKDHAPSEALVG